MAEEALAEDDDEKLLTSFFLFKSAIEKMSGGSMDLRVSDLTSDSGRDRIKSGLGDIAQRLHTSSNELYARLEEWRSEERRVRKECVSTCRSRCSSTN